MGRGGQRVAETKSSAATKPAGAEKLAPEDEWIGSLDLSGFRDEIRALGKELEAGQGPADAAHLRKLMMWTDICGIVGLFSLWATPNPITVLAMSTWIYTRWTMFGHHICHGGYDKLSSKGLVSSRFNRFVFAAGSLFRRYTEWFDWFLPEAWSIEHNQRHHYCLGETEDPDLVEHNLASIRDGTQARWIKVATVSALTVAWKWYYYAPNTYKELKLSALRRAGKAPPAACDPSKPCVLEHFLYYPADKMLFTFAEFFGRVMCPYIVGHFMMLPAFAAAAMYAIGESGVMAAPMEPRQAAWNAFINLIFAELATNFHAFVTIATNHCGDDLYRFGPGCRFASGTFYLRQVISSVDYAAGNDLCDYLHGFLNYQIEHHLWPNLSMLSYQRAHPRVQLICAKYGVPFIKQSCFKRTAKTIQLMVGDISMRKYPLEYECQDDLSTNSE